MSTVLYLFIDTFKEITWTAKKYIFQFFLIRWMIYMMDAQSIPIYTTQLMLIVVRTAYIVFVFFHRRMIAIHFTITPKCNLFFFYSTWLSVFFDCCLNLVILINGFNKDCPQTDKNTSANWHLWQKPNSNIIIKIEHWRKDLV